MALTKVSYSMINGAYINVLDYGATGNGTTDDTAAVQAAANAAVGKVLYFPPGSYKIVDGFDVIGNGTSIVGDSAILLYPKTSSISNHCIRINGNSCYVANLTIQSPAGLVRNDTGFAISVGDVNTQTQNVEINNVSCINIGSAAIWFSNVDGPLVSNCFIKDCKADGIHFSDGCSRIIADSNILIGNEDDNIAVVNDTVGAPYVSNFVISNNYIDGSGLSTGSLGIAVIGASVGTISGNTINNTYKAGIGTYFWTDTQKTDVLLISGNTLFNTGVASGTNGGLGIILQQNSNVTIIGNYFSQIGYSASATANGAIWITDGANINIKSNVFQNLSCDGIVLTQNGDANLDIIATDNTFDNVVRTPILIGGTAILSSTVANNNTFVDTLPVSITAGTEKSFFQKGQVFQLTTGTSIAINLDRSVAVGVGSIVIGGTVTTIGTVTGQYLITGTSTVDTIKAISGVSVTTNGTSITITNSTGNTFGGKVLILQ
jgi:hypothetical protein